MNHIPIDLYDGDLLQKKRKEEDSFCPFVWRFMSDFARAMKYIR